MTTSIDAQVFTGDAGAGGAKGFVPAPAAGDAAAGKVLTAAGTFAVPNALGAITGTSLTLTQGTIAADAQVLTATSTWNNGAVTFTGLKYTVTDTASAAASLLVDLRVGANSVFKVSKAGDISIYNTASGFTSTMTFSFGNVTFGSEVRATGRLGASSEVALGSLGAADIVLTRDAAAILALRNGTNAQTFRSYYTYTNASNYQRLALNAGATSITLAAETLGTGADDIDVILAPAGTGVVSTAARLTALSGTAIPAGGTTGAGYRFSSTANFGVFFGSGAPSLSAAKGSLYLRSDGSTTTDRMYVNTDGGTGWAAVITAS